MILIGELKARMVYNPAWDEPELYIRLTTDKTNYIKFELKSVSLREPIEPVQRQDENPPATTSKLVQAIMDAAWEFGMRPTAFKDFQNENEAIKYHLEDMRKLIFKEKPNATK